MQNQKKPEPKPETKKPKLSDIIELETTFNDERKHILISAWDEGIMPEMKAVGMARDPKGLSYFSFTVCFQGDKVTSVKVHEKMDNYNAQMTTQCEMDHYLLDKFKDV